MIPFPFFLPSSCNNRCSFSFWRQKSWSRRHWYTFLFFFFSFFFVLFCFVLFCFVLFCFVLFCFVLFCFVLFCFVLFCFVLFITYNTLHIISLYLVLNILLGSTSLDLSWKLKDAPSIEESHCWNDIHSSKCEKYAFLLSISFSAIIKTKQNIMIMMTRYKAPSLSITYWTTACSSVFFLFCFFFFSFSGHAAIRWPLGNHDKAQGY